MRSKPMASKVVWVAFAANLAIALTKFIAAVLTGSSAMLSEGIHSLVDTINEVLLLYGMKRAGKAADASHPFGYGRELYFWSFIVSLLVLALGSGAAFYEGVSHLLDPQPMRITADQLWGAGGLFRVRGQFMVVYVEGIPQDKG